MGPDYHWVRGVGRSACFVRRLSALGVVLAPFRGARWLPMSSIPCSGMRREVLAVDRPLAEWAVDGGGHALVTWLAGDRGGGGAYCSENNDDDHSRRRPSVCVV